MNTTPANAHAPRERPAAQHQRLAALCGAALLFAACASPTAPPTEQMAVSNAAIAQAVSAGAAETAPLEMGMAREKMVRARAAFDAQVNDRALALAREAQLDAQLAQAKAESVKSRKASEAMAESNRVLREEMNRKTP